MKKFLLITSLVLMSAWITGVFLLKAPALIHAVLVLSLLAYIRSLMTRETNTLSYNHHK